MRQSLKAFCLVAVGICGVALSGCATGGDVATQATTAVAKGSAEAGTHVARKGETLALSKGGLKVGASLPTVSLADNAWKPYAFSADGKVKLISIVPSIDTRVCELQTHLLGDTMRLDPQIQRITLSRDLPAAQKRFAMESDLTNVTYLSDYRSGGFGQATGLLIEENGLLARSVLVVDGQGKVRYMQIVPDITELPDMDRAFDEANKLVK